MKFSPSTPIVILTGSMNEETAVECMKAGASRLYHKGTYGKAPVRSQGGNKRKKEERLRAAAEEALEESERKFRLIAEKANDLVYNMNYSQRENSRMSALLPQRLQAIHRRSTLKSKILVSNWSILMTDGNLTGFQSK